jgi:hypothetical protein
VPPPVVELAASSLASTGGVALCCRSDRKRLKKPGYFALSNSHL